ncbi:MAG TPA: phosphodiester glycosidase family protein [Frankiaceae bacterium]|nr:phosphodiester glycosidase family protein [Frankiaceae bacterium]
MAVLLLVLVTTIGYSLGQALRRPGNDGAAARLAEWARDHQLGWAVTTLEKASYDQHPPRRGGAPAEGVPVVGGLGPSGPAPVPVLAGGAPLPHEGQWQVVSTVGSRPAVRLAFLRPDDQHTSYLATVMWLDPTTLSARLHPGTQDPGGQWTTPSEIDPQLQQSVIAAFPGGFRLNGDSRGGYFDQGRTAVPLRTGAASFVVDVDGSVQIGQWGRDVQMNPRIRAVRQNLDLLVDGAKVNSSCGDNQSSVWGRTVGNADYVPRTGLGQRADGSLVFINSPATSVCSLARLLQAAGTVRGMELDINKTWAIGYYYDHAGSLVTAHKSRPDQDHSEQRYFSPQTRDFIAFYARS